MRLSQDKAMGCLPDGFALRLTLEPLNQAPGLLLFSYWERKGYARMTRPRDVLRKALLSKKHAA
jgi:hypothetical protein